MKNKMTLIIPTVFAKTKKEFEKRFSKLIGISRNFQIDFMDGKFVASQGISLKDIPNLKKFKGKNFEAHLMVSNPSDWISDLKNKGFKKIIFHYEACSDVNEIKQIIDKIGKGGVVAFNPSTSINEIISILKETKIKNILLMGVKPGKEGQKIDSNIYKRISNIKRFDKEIRIQVDGGVNDKTIKNLAEAGADYFNVGSFFSRTRNPKEVFKKLENKL